MTTPEFAWLIERADSPTTMPTYWAGVARWTTDPLEAVRFSRKADGMRVAETLTTPVRILEHGWG